MSQYGKADKASRDNVVLRHRIEELEARSAELEMTVADLKGRVQDLEVALAERVGYETRHYADQPQAIGW